MNKRNDWKGLLEIANEDLKPYGYQLYIFDDDEGFYTCKILKDNAPAEIFAENYYEDELSDLITEASHYVREKYLPWN